MEGIAKASPNLKGQSQAAFSVLVFAAALSLSAVDRLTIHRLISFVAGIWLSCVEVVELHDFAVFRSQGHRALFPRTPQCNSNGHSVCQM